MTTTEYASQDLLRNVHDTLANLVYLYGGVDSRDVAVEFALPTPRIVQTFSGPTILFSLIDIWENLELRNAGFAMTRYERNGEEMAAFRSTPRYFDMKFLVSMHASEPEDEHALLSRLLWTFYRHQEIPAEVLPPGFLDKEWKMNGRVASQNDTPRPMEVWSDLASDPRPSLLYFVTAPIDIERAAVSPLVLSRVHNVRPFRGDDGAPPDPSLWDDQEMLPNGEPIPTPQERQERLLDGGTVSYGGYLVDRNGNRLPGCKMRLEGVAFAETVTDAEGRFVWHRLTMGRYRLIVTTADGSEQPEIPLTIRGEQTRQEHRITLNM